jgi:hypothetical protein
MKRFTVLIPTLTLSFSVFAGPVSVPGGAKVFTISSSDRATVSSPVTVQIGLEGFGVALAGLEKANTGHHHLIIDNQLPDMDLPIPPDEHYRHFGGGQTQVTIELTPG